jgi:uncharacterized Zn finger protein (UPF0148 family)
MEKPDFRWSAPGGPKAVMVVDSEYVARTALAGGLALADLIEKQCPDCETPLFITTADVLGFHDALDEFPAEVLCPNCHRAREEKEESRHDAAMRAVMNAAIAEMGISDPGDRLQAVLPGAVAEVLDICRNLLEDLQTVARVAASWRIAPAMLLDCVTQHVDAEK